MKIFDVLYSRIQQQLGYNMHIAQLYNLAVWNIIFFVLMEIALGDSLEVGDICSVSEKCGQFMVCLDNRCTCDPVVEMIPVFSSHGTQIGVKCIEKEKCDYKADPPKMCGNTQCDIEPGKEHGVCSCREDAMRTINSINNDTCWPYKRKHFNQLCGHASPMCDEMKGLTCRFGHCLCKADQMFEFKELKCVSQQPYLSRFNLTKYQGRWGDYCAIDEDCLDILECAYNKSCECPYDCNGYIKDHDSCLCGDREYPTGPVLVGIFVGFVIVFFWCYQIDKLCKKYKKNRTLEPEQEVPITRDEGTQDGPRDGRLTGPPMNDSPPHYNTITATENMAVLQPPPLYVIEDRPPTYEDVVKMDLKEASTTEEMLDIKKAATTDDELEKTKLKDD